MELRQGTESSGAWLRIYRPWWIASVSGITVFLRLVYLTLTLLLLSIHRPRLLLSSLSSQIRNEWVPIQLSALLNITPPKPYQSLVQSVCPSPTR